jgi:AcrR family transcriptional regulator
MACGRVPTKVNTEERIHQAALSLFMKKGFAATSVREIAKAAGITSASLYYYMPSKEDLLVAVALRAIRLLAEPGREIDRSGGSPDERLTALIRLHVLEHARGRRLWEVADEDWRQLEKKQRAPIVELRDEYQSFWESALDGGRTDGLFHFDDLKLTTFAILSMCSGVYKWFSPGGRLTAEDVAANHLEQIGAMLGTPSLVPTPLVQA